MSGSSREGFITSDVSIGLSDKFIVGDGCTGLHVSKNSASHGLNVIPLEQKAVNRLGEN